MQQRIGTGKIGHALDLRADRRPDRLHVAVIPAHTIREAGQQRVGLDQGSLRPTVKNVAALDAGQFLRSVAPQLNGGRGHGGPRGVDLHANQRPMGVDPQGHLHPGVSPAETGRKRAVPGVEPLTETDSSFRRAVAYAQPHGAYFHQPAVIVPAIGARDIELQIAGPIDPRVQGHLAVAQRHGAVGVSARRIPDHFVGRHGAVGQRSGRCQQPTQQHDGAHHDAPPRFRRTAAPVRCPTVTSPARSACAYAAFPGATDPRHSGGGIPRRVAASARPSLALARAAGWPDPRSPTGRGPG